MWIRSKGRGKVAVESVVGMYPVLLCAMRSVQETALSVAWRQSTTPFCPSQEDPVERLVGLSSYWFYLLCFLAVEITRGNTCFSNRYEVCKPSEDGSEYVTLSVYFREKTMRQSSNTSGTILFGQPLLISVPKQKLTVDHLYSVVLEQIR